MVGDASPTGYFGQTYALEFNVEGDLDGTTVSPTIDNSPPTGIGNADPQHLYRRTVEALGLIDPDYLPAQAEDDRRGARGNRLIAFLWIEGPSAGAVGASVDIVDAIDGTPVTQDPIGSLEGRTTLFRKAIFLPQGSMIRVNGMSGSSAAPIKVRFHVQFLDNAENIALALQAASAENTPDTFLQEFGAFLATAVAIPGAALTPMPLDALFIPFDATVYAHTLGSSDVTVLQAGRYLIEVEASIDNTVGAARTSSAAALFVDSGAGFLPVPGTTAFGYHRNAANGEDTLPSSATLDLSAGDVIRFAAIRIAGTGPLAYIASACRLRIVRVPTL